MSIRFDPAAKTLTLLTRSTCYQMQISEFGYLLHLYYGQRAVENFRYLCQTADVGFSPNPYESKLDRRWSLDTLPQEYSSTNTADFRLSSLNLCAANGAWGADLRYVRHAVTPGAYAVTGMPCAFDKGGESETLAVVLRDASAGVEVELLYGVFPEQDVITRAARIRNTADKPLRLFKAASACLDLPFGRWELLHFHGRHAMERILERTPVATEIQTVSSRRGASSHQQNPFVILCREGANEDSGDCVAVMPVYSGSHRTDVERDQMGSVRVVTGIHDEQFSWQLNPGESFDTPQVLLSFSACGLTPLSQTLHRFLRGNICRSRWTNRRRPVLLNNWEATYFDFTADKLLRIAREARNLGVELFVLDDGWFGRRSDDNRALGDWFVNEDKLPGGLETLIAGIKELGLRFGLWVEPEMVSEDSDLYRAHPDWALTVPGRDPAMSRNQLVLDLARPEVVDWLYDTLSGLLRRCDISYIKWDMNRHLTDVYSHALPPERQGEAPHRYVLGLYSLLERLTAAFPEVLFEGCAGGGGRFDAGMLAYFPQIWCSDDTDPIERLSIQKGTSYGYPVSAVGSHVSASPNHQTGRGTPLGTRAVVAMAGSFGYELDPTRLSEEERREIPGQIQRFSRYYDLIHGGDYYRLEPDCGPESEAWSFVSPEKDEALLCLVVKHPEANPAPLHLRLKGLDPAARYRITQTFFGAAVPAALQADDSGDALPVLSGAALLYGGYTLPRLFGDYPSALIHLEKI